MDLQKIKDVLKEYAQNKELDLFDVTYRRSDQILSVTFDEELSMDKLEEISAEVSKLLDAYEDEFDDNYFLDVSTVGAERPIRNEEELNKAVGNYIFVKDKDGEYYGDLVSFENGIIRLEVKDKNRTRTVEVDYKNTKEVRYAVRF